MTIAWRTVSPAYHGTVIGPAKGAINIVFDETDAGGIPESRLHFGGVKGVADARYDVKPSSFKQWFQMFGDFTAFMLP